ncbi:MAG: Gfo/Idh/MocA family protein [Candidatus Binatia bacterium]
MPPPPLRIGTLGAARITPVALIRPARFVPEVAVTAIAARDPARARAFAARHGIARVHDSYASLIADPEIDAVYNPLPNSHHAEWTIRALEAGKHVLCEKPLAANVDEARAMADAAMRCDKRLIEAFHWRFHPLAERMRSIIAAGTIGAVRHIDAAMCLPLPLPGDIRYRYELAGGATMDLGCYTISLVRFLAGAEPEVARAEARLSSPNVDRCMTAELRFADGCTARILCSLFSRRLLKLQAIVRGDRGELRVLNPYAPQYYNRLTVHTALGTTRERVPGQASYYYQLRAFAHAVRSGDPTPADPPDSIANMAVIDAVYKRAGLPRRGT